MPDDVNTTNRVPFFFGVTLIGILLPETSPPPRVTHVDPVDVCKVTYTPGSVMLEVHLPTIFFPTLPELASLQVIFGVTRT